MMQALDQLSAELLPCPFCGCSMTLTTRTERDGYMGDRTFYVPSGKHTGLGGHCSGQDVRGSASIEAATTRWNTRTGQLVAVAGDAVERVARIIEPGVWGIFDRALKPFQENRGSVGDENWLYEVTWRRKGFRTEAEVRDWFISGTPNPDEHTYNTHLCLQYSLRTATAAIAEMKDTQPALAAKGTGDE